VGETYPTKDMVEGWINEVEDYVDHETNHAWRTKQVTEEFYDFDSPFGTLFLKHRGIKPLDSNEGDKLEVASYKTSGVWTDFLTEYQQSTTEDGSGDFYVNTADGIISFKNQFPDFGTCRIRITYRYGSDDTDEEFKIISRATAFLVIADMALQNRFSNVAPQPGKDVTPLLTMSDRFKAKGDDLLRGVAQLKRPQHSQIITYSPWRLYYG